MLRKLFQTTSVLLILVSFIGCKKELELETEVGSIQGVVQFENTSNHEGIDVFLESTDGLVATTYYSARGIKSNARIVTSSVKTDKTGTFYFNEVPTGVYTISASSSLSHEKAILTNVIVQKSAITELEVIKLQATGNINGSITIDNTKDNVYGIDILVLGTSYTAVTDEDGKYIISDVPVKEEGYSLAIRKNDYTYIFKTSVTVKPGESINIDNIDIKSNDFNTNYFIWKGFSDAAPKNPKLNWAYFNTTDNCIYIFNGTAWVKDGQNGKDGIDGTNGKDGLSIIWKGESETAPKNPELYWAYFNTTDGCSYIWNGKNWDKLSQAGDDGTDGKDGSDGINGVDGISIIWKGVYITAPENPELNWAYFNLMDGSSYIWNGYKWDYLAKGGEQNCIHEFTSWEEKEATEFVEGYKKTSCAICGIEYEEIIPRLPIPLVNPEPYTTRVKNLNHIFNNQTLGTTTITMKRSEWNKLCDNYRYFYKNENYVHAEKYEYTKDGQTWEIPNVGFRQRGNTSRFCPQGVDNGRLQGQSNADWSEDYYNYAERENDDYRQVHFKVDFEEFLEGDEELKMAGCMKGVALKRMDHSWGREIFCYDLFHKFGIWTAPRASHTRVILNFIEDTTDNSITTVDYGVYEMFEEVNKQSLKARAQGEGEEASNLWANNKGNLWKCSSDLTLDGLNQTGVEDIRIIFDDEGNPIGKVWDGYRLDLKTNKDELSSAETELHGFIRELNALPTDTSNESIATIKAFYEKWFDMDFFLKTYAINILLGMDDDYWGNGNNYYLYFDTGKKGTGKLYFIPFDYDNTLGCSIKEGGFLQNPLEWGRGENRPLMDRMLLVPEFKQKFIDLLYEVSDEKSYWNFERCSKQFLDWRTMLESYAKSPDLHDKISQKYWGDYTWQPEGYSLTNYFNNIYDATRYAIRGEENPNILKISEIECDEGIKIEIKNIPESACIRQVYVNGKQIAKVDCDYDERLTEIVKSTEFFYPYTKEGNEYSIYVEYLDDSFSNIGKSKEIIITAQGGKGEIQAPEVSYTFENNILTFTNEANLWCNDSKPIIPSNYVVEIQVKDFKGYVSYNWISTENLSLDLAKENTDGEGNVTYTVAPEYRNSELIFTYYAEINSTKDGSYRYVIYDYDNLNPLIMTN